MSCGDQELKKAPVDFFNSFSLEARISLNGAL